MSTENLNRIAELAERAERTLVGADTLIEDLMTLYGVPLQGRIAIGELIATRSEAAQMLSNLAAEFEAEFERTFTFSQDDDDLIDWNIVVTFVD